jgi:uncharacterized protein YciI
MMAPGHDTMPLTYYALFYDAVDGFLDKRAPFRAEHLALVRQALEQGEIVMAGALGDPPTGALLVFRAASAAVAEDFARRDPYVIHGVVVQWHVKLWNLVVGP